MLQKNSFFSSPLIFFGSSHSNEEEVYEEQDWNFSESWTLSIEELSPTANGQQAPCRNWIDSSANSAVNGRDCARAAVHSSTHIHPENRIGLFILWTDPEELEDQF